MLIKIMPGCWQVARFDRHFSVMSLVGAHLVLQMHNKDIFCVIFIICYTAILQNVKATPGIRSCGRKSLLPIPMCGWNMIYGTCTR